VASKAYALGFIDPTVDPPVVTEVGIYSERRPTITRRGSYAFCLVETTAETFGDAREACEALLAQAYPWAHALLLATRAQELPWEPADGE
jgi:hypothetical protein